MKKEILICDLCNAELAGNHWETGRLWPLSISSNTSCDNGFRRKGLVNGSFQSCELKMELCSSCATDAANTLSESIIKLKQLKEVNL